MNPLTLDEIVERVTTRYYGKYRGTVTDVQDPTGSLRIKATVPDVLGSLESGWCLPCVPFAGPNAGFCFLPEVSSSVWIEFEGGDPSYPIWTGCFWLTGDTPSDVSAKKRGIITAAGHRLILDDDAEEITIEDANGAKISFSSGAITMSSSQNAQVAVDGQKVSVNDGALEVQ